MLSASMSLRETTEHCGGLAQVMAAIDDWLHLSRLEESAQDGQVLLSSPRHEEGHAVAGEPRDQHPGQHTTQPAAKSAAVGPPTPPRSRPRPCARPCGPSA